MRFDRKFFLVAGVLVLAGVAGWLWLRLEADRLFSPDLAFRRNPNLRIVHVLDVHPLRHSTEYSLYGDGRLAVEVWEHVENPRFSREGKLDPSLGYLLVEASKPRLLSAHEFQLSREQLDWLWADLASSGVLGLDGNLLFYQMSKLGNRGRRFSFTEDGLPPASIRVELDSGTRQTRFQAGNFRETAALYPELPALAGAVRLFNRLAGYGLGTLDVGRGAAETDRSTGQTVSSLH